MLVSATELIQYMSGISLTPAQRVDVESTLSGVQAELETYLNRPLELTQIRETVRTDGRGFANLTVSPVVKVVAVQAIEAHMLPQPLNTNGTYIPLPMERDTLIGEGGRLTDYLATGVTVGDPLTVPGGVFVGTPNTYFVLDYVGGYDLRNRPEFEGVRTAIKRVAAREAARQHDDTLSLRGDNATTAAPDDNREKGWTEDELMRWDRLRRRVVV